MSPERLDLRRVTLVAASNFALAQTRTAMARCLEQARFGAALFLGPDIGGPWPAEVRTICEPGIDGIASYSHFLLRRLADHVATDFALIVQWDGYIIDPAAWDDAYFGYDYIGAIWPQFADDKVVGNGGFSLRSRRLLTACQDPRLCADEPEDLAICRTGRAFLESEFGIRFAPRDVAERFSVERGAVCGPTFGFHGVFNLPRILGEGFAHYYRELPVRAVSARDNRDLLQSAVAAGRIGLALTILVRERTARGWTNGVAAALAALIARGLQRMFGSRNQTRSF